MNWLTIKPLMLRTCMMYAETIFCGGYMKAKYLGISSKVSIVQVLIVVKIKNGIKKAYMKSQV